MLSWLPEAASSYAAHLDGLIALITGIVGAWFVAAEILLIGFVIRYHRRRGRSAAYIPGDTLRTMSFVLVPCAVILGFDLVIDAAAAKVWEEVKLELPPGDELVRIEGVQWAWNFTLAGPDGRLDTADDIPSPGELHVPLDKVVQFELTARDVLHSLWIPEFRLKQDAVPGRRIRGWFRPTRAGSYEFICAEICGVAHTLMKGSIVVETPEQYARWLASRTSAASPAEGRTPGQDQG